MSSVVNSVSNAVFGKPPDAPDYGAAAQATANGDLAATRAAAAANRVNQYTPYGTQTWAHTGTDPDNGWSVTQTLSPQERAKLDKSNNLQNGMLDAAGTGMWYLQKAVANGGAIDQSKLQGIRDFQSPEQLNTDPLAGTRAFGAQNQVGLRDLQASPIASGQTVQDAVMSRLTPQIITDRESLRTRLANQGLSEGTEAYNNAMRLQGQQENDLYAQAALQGINAGLQNRQQDLTARGQELTASQTNADNTLTARGQDLQGNIQNIASALAQRQGDASNTLAARGQDASLRQQGIAEQYAAQSRPLDLVNALMGGTQVNNPTWANVPQQQTTSGADMLSAAGMQFNGANQTFRNQQANNKQLYSGLAQIFGG